MVTRRRAETVYGGWWEFPGGKIEAGERPEACAVREAVEELGITVRPHRALAIVQHVYEHAAVELHPWLCTVAPGSPPPANLEVAEHRWVPLADLPGDGFLPANASIVDDLRAILADRETVPLSSDSHDDGNRSRYRRNR